MDWNDEILYGIIVLIIFIIIFVFVYNTYNNAIEECGDIGGYIIWGRGTIYCVDKSVIKE